MSKIVFIKENSPEARRKLEQAGFTICICAKFKDSIWLTYHPEGVFYRDIHGEGYADKGDWDEKYSPLERIQMRLKEDDYYSNEREFFETVEQFLKIYNKSQ